VKKGISELLVSELWDAVSSKGALKREDKSSSMFYYPSSTIPSSSWPHPCLSETVYRLMPLFNKVLISSIILTGLIKIFLVYCSQHEQNQT
jgi:hypothetical protein